MAFEFRLPDIGEGLTEATVVRWIVSDGADVTVDQPMVEMETDKAVVEIPSPRAGVILHLGALEGEALAVGEVLVVIGDAGESWVPGGAETAEGTVRPASTQQAAPIVGTLEEAESVVPAAPDAQREAPVSMRPPALPLVRRLAATMGVDLDGVRGSGPGGRVVREDVEGAASSTAGPVERVRLSPTRRSIASNLTRSWQEIPHVTTFGTAEAEPLLEERRRLSDEAGVPVPLEALLIGRLTPLLQRHREFNAVIEGDDLVYRLAYHVGFAVDTPNGLMVAVVRDAEQRTPVELAQEVRRLAESARNRTITAAQMRGATFTVSNIGAVGGGFGTPIIPYGTAAILSVGRADLRPVIRDGAVAPGREFPLSLSYDHRIIDGAAGRAFMADLIEVVEG